MEQGKVILVDEQDVPIGIAGKMEAHQQGMLHRAFSIFIFNSKGEMLLQQRAMQKYHSGGLWSNTCCSHPAPGEDILVSAVKRLKDEMGFETSLEKIFDFVYKTEFENGLTEHEFDQVFCGNYDGPIVFNIEEVMDCGYKTIEEIGLSLANQPGSYTPWFKVAFPRVLEWWQRKYNKVDQRN